MPTDPTSQPQLTTVSPNPLVADVLSLSDSSAAVSSSSGDGAKVSFAIHLSSGAGLSALVVPDIAAVTAGKAPVYISKPISIDLQKLVDFLKAKQITLPTEIEGALGSITVSCDAFYFARPTSGPTASETDVANKVKKKGDSKALAAVGDPIDTMYDLPMLMVFAIQMKDGLIGSLTGDDDLEKMFSVKGAEIRVMRCSATQLPILKEYVRSLQA